ncbi:hypothetical protein MMYC01_200785 [Madurella mycetomatis]|uniref:Mid2 domain-containing protein n=1 Tax=Madurella mycetomatis TaxID=100816 RepID=A0A175WG95_9PEZI|nr:hypothetical protein MMYC01_200785 [Madurella mycetomatis]
MKLSRTLELLVLGLSAISVAEATFVKVNHGGSNVRALQQRQDDEGDSNDEVTSTGDAPETSSTPPPQTSTSASPTESSTSTPTDDPTSSTSDPDPTTRSSRPPSTSSTAPPETSDEPTPSTSPGEQDPTVITRYTTITSTNSDGIPMTLTSSSLSTPPPGLADGGNGGSGQSGMSPQTRDTVIGVVVGVGGAIILGGLALVAWRIWGRKKHHEENDVLMDYNSTVDKPETVGSASARSPFQSTLESYHAPTQVNTAANF